MKCLTGISKHERTLEMVLESKRQYYATEEQG